LWQGRSSAWVHEQATGRPQGCRQDLAVPRSPLRGCRGRLARADDAVADLIAEPPHRPRNTDPDPAWRLAGATVTEQVTRARGLLGLTTAGLVPERAAFRHPTPTRLLARRTVLGASRDLLATHTDLTSGGPVDRTPEAAPLRTASARHQLLATAPGYAEQLAPMANSIATKLSETDHGKAAMLRTIAGHLATAAVSVQFVWDRDADGHALIDRVASVEPLHRRAAPEEGETPGQLLEQALASARRLRLFAFRDVSADVPSHHSARTLATVASAMVASHVTRVRLLDGLRHTPESRCAGRPCQLAARLRQVLPESRRI